MRAARWVRRCGALVAGGAILALPAAPAAAQVHVRDLVVTLGGSVEGYSGNLSAVTVPVVDSTNHAAAAVGEVGVRGDVALYNAGGRSLGLAVDAGMRQSAALGFTLRDYAPREWVGTTSLSYQQTLARWGLALARLGFRGRSVKDRPPMPLFLQPGYGTWQGSLGIVTRAFDGVSFDVRGDVESADYRALEFAPQLDLLDRRSAGVLAGVRWGAASTVRFFGGVRWTEYRHQPSFDPTDPFRRDRTVTAGVEWMYVGDVRAEVGLEGTLNRSNSNRPEYDALSFRALFTAPLPWETILNVRAVLTGKSYVHETQFARLVPGEEADNASIAYLQLSRPLASNLDGAVRLGWTRAETDIGSAYYRRFGGSIRFNYRPTGR